LTQVKEKNPNSSIIPSRDDSGILATGGSDAAPGKEFGWKSNKLKNGW
jgi:hypothetical protein